MAQKMNIWHAARSAAENVCLSGQTGNAWRMVRMTRLTQLRLGPDGPNWTISHSRQSRSAMLWMVGRSAFAAR